MMETNMRMEPDTEDSKSAIVNRAIVIRQEVFECLEHWLPYMMDNFNNNERMDKYKHMDYDVIMKERACIEDIVGQRMQERSTKLSQSSQHGNKRSTLCMRN